MLLCVTCFDWMLGWGLQAPAAIGLLNQASSCCSWWSAGLAGRAMFTCAFLLLCVAGAFK